MLKVFVQMSGLFIMGIGYGCELPKDAVIGYLMIASGSLLFVLGRKLKER